MVMAFLTLVLKEAVNRWTNAVLGAVGVWQLSIGIWVGVLSGTFDGGRTFVALVQSLVPLLIVWHAWKWPRPTEVIPSGQSQETRRGA